MMSCLNLGLMMYQKLKVLMMILWKSYMRLFVVKVKILDEIAEPAYVSADEGVVSDVSDTSSRHSVAEDSEESEGEDAESVSESESPPVRRSARGRIVRKIPTHSKLGGDMVLEEIT